LNLFLDSSVLLAACGSSQGASSLFIEQAQTRHWKLLVSPYVLSEVENNLSYFGNDALPLLWITGHETGAVSGTEPKCRLNSNLAMGINIQTGHP